MHKIFLLLIATIFFVVTMNGCIHHRFTPEPLPIDSKILQTKLNNCTIAIINNQKDNSEKVIREGSGHKYFANLHDWTESASGLLQNEIKKRGCIVSEKSERTISISITDASLEFLTWVRNSRILLDVQIGSGYVAKYEGNGSSAFGKGAESYAIDVSISSAIEAMLRDTTVVNYLTGDHSKNSLDRLEELNTLKKRGLITIEEFEKKKKQILDEL